MIELILLIYVITGIIFARFQYANQVDKYNKWQLTDGPTKLRKVREDIHTLDHGYHCEVKYGEPCDCHKRNEFVTLISEAKRLGKMEVKNPFPNYLVLATWPVYGVNKVITGGHKVEEKEDVYAEIDRLEQINQIGM